MKICAIICLLLSSVGIEAQSTSINFELNDQQLANLSNNPFGRFVGEWALKDEEWIQNWGYGTDTIKIPKHHTVTTAINTGHSLLSIIDGPEPNGHILWTMNPVTKEVHHISSFGEIRVGTGTGIVNEAGDVSLDLVFEGESPGTYRHYEYKWINENEYHMKSVQYSADDELTGLFYEGSFIRITQNDNVRKEILAILKILDDYKLPKDEQIAVYTEDVVHMAPNNKAITNRKDLLTYIQQQEQYGYADMKHSIVEMSNHGNAIIMRGEVQGTFYPSNKTEPIAFSTKNLFVFKRENKELKISKVIYNSDPVN